MVDVEVHRLEVGAGAEGLAAGAGEDEHARTLVGLEFLQPLPERLRRGSVDRVAPLGPVDRQHRRRADPLVAKLLAHRVILPESMGVGGLVVGVTHGAPNNARLPNCVPARAANEGRSSMTRSNARQRLGRADTKMRLADDARLPAACVAFAR